MTTARTVLLTGASSGIGAAIRDRLLAEGHRVIGVARRAEPRAESAYVALPLDLSRRDDIAPAVREVARTHPGLDAAILCAGAPAFGNLEEWSEAAIHAALEINLTAAILVARAVLPVLKQRERSDLVFIGSEAALRGGKRGAIYCAAKFGLRGFAEALREEVSAAGVRVSMVHPGMVRTPFFDGLDFAPGEEPENALEPADVAAAVSLILSARTGTVIDEVRLSPLKKVIKFPPRRGER